MVMTHMCVATGLCGDASTDYASSLETARMLWYFVRGGRCVTSIVMCSGGKTWAVLPETALDTVLLSDSETHWATTEPLLELLKQYERTVVLVRAGWF